MDLLDVIMTAGRVSRPTVILAAVSGTDEMQHDSRSHVKYRPIEVWSCRPSVGSVVVREWRQFVHS
jgi:hypothetical protein